MTTDEATQEQEFLANYNPHAYNPIGLSVDVVILTIHAGELSALLVKRGGHPYKGHWALPGGFVEQDESAEEAALRELREETNIDLDGHYHLEQLKTYTAPKRDPRMRVISTAYIALLPEVGAPRGGDDAQEARFFPVQDILEPMDENDRIPLAFDHTEILQDALERAASKLEYTTLATSFLAEPFTLADLRRVYEKVWRMELNAASFRRKVLSTEGMVIALGQKGTPQLEGGRSAELYVHGEAQVLHPAILRQSTAP